MMPKEPEQGKGQILVGKCKRKQKTVAVDRRREIRGQFLALRGARRSKRQQRSWPEPDEKHKDRLKDPPEKTQAICTTNDHGIRAVSARRYRKRAQEQKKAENPYVARADEAIPMPRSGQLFFN